MTNKRMRYIYGIFGAALLAVGCQSSDVNDDRDEFESFLPPPAGLVCEFTGCDADDDCTDPAAPFCARQSGQCEECASDADCAELASGDASFIGRTLCRQFQCVCDPANGGDTYCQEQGLGAVCAFGACATCGRDADCITSTSSVSTASSVCVGAGTAGAFCGCGDAGDCGEDEICAGGTCTNDLSCESDADCAEEAPLTICSPSEVCVECIVNDDCPSAAPLCDDGACAAAFCENNAACTDSEAGSVCLAPGTLDAACGCEGDADCSGASAAGPFCVSGECTAPACESDADCTSPSAPVCVNAGTADAVCGCSTSADCTTAGFSSCDSGTCYCADNADCSNAGLGTECIRFGPQFGTCTCNADDQCDDNDPNTVNECRAPVIF